MVGLFLGDAILLLEFSGQNVAAAIDLQEFVIRQLAPLLLDFAAELLPLASDLFPLIGRLSHGQFPFMSEISYGRYSNLTVAVPWLSLSGQTASARKQAEHPKQHHRADKRHDHAPDIEAGD